MTEQQLTEKKLELAIKWLNDIRRIGSATSILASAALNEIEALDSQFPLGMEGQV
jgi:hypothetical protein